MDKELKLSYRQKNPSICPICSFEFHREELFSGGGRLIAGKLTDELRRNFEVSKKFGKVYPLAYLLTVCPSCYYSAYSKDFETPDTGEIDKIRELTPGAEKRHQQVFQCH